MRSNEEMKKQELISRFSKGSFMWIGGACLMSFAGSYFIANSGISWETIKSVGVGCVVVAGCAFVFR
jgi:hypothetical protein